MENKINETTEEILDEIEFDIRTKYGRICLGEYVKAKLYELLEYRDEQ